MSGVEEGTVSAEPVKKERPAHFVQDIMGKQVGVKLTTGSTYTGRLACLDANMNIALQGTEEYRGGRLQKKYGDAFLRGNNVLYISLPTEAGN